MPRTNDGKVMSVLGGDYDCNACPDLTRFIRAANVMVSRVKACAADRGVTLTADELVEMETWLACHFYVMSDQNYSSRSTLSASAQFQGRTDMGLDASKYGQSAKLIDYSGCLTAISKRQVATLLWGGKPPSDQIPYEDRD